MAYIENPKTKGSGIICAIPQSCSDENEPCPNKCADCFFQSGRSYLEPLTKNLPNMPSAEQARGRVVRVNDGNDSNNQRELVVAAAAQYEMAFFNTSIPCDLDWFLRPVVLTVNPGAMTDSDAHLLRNPPPNLMFVRFRVNSWNLDLCDRVVAHYAALQVPVVLTFMAYYNERVKSGHEDDYAFRKRTLNPYWCITPEAWTRIVSWYSYNPLVHACGKNALVTACRHCGNCLREYFATVERTGIR